MHEFTELATAMFPTINTNRNSTSYKQKKKIKNWHVSKMYEFATFLKILCCNFTKQLELLKLGNTTYARFGNIYTKHNFGNFTHGINARFHKKRKCTNL